MRDAFKDSVTDDVFHDVTMDCVDSCGNAHTLEATLGYTATDPYAVTLTFNVPEDKVVWTFSRELLMLGLDEPAGDGDVHVWPETDSTGSAGVMIELCSPDGHLLALARTRDVRRFLTLSCRLVPVDSESQHLDIDGLLSQLFTA